MTETIWVGVLGTYLMSLGFILGWYSDFRLRTKYHKFCFCIHLVGMLLLLASATTAVILLTIRLFN